MNPSIFERLVWTRYTFADDGQMLIAELLEWLYSFETYKNPCLIVFPGFCGWLSGVGVAGVFSVLILTWMFCDRL